MTLSATRTPYLRPIERPFLQLDRVDRTREVFRLARQDLTAREIGDALKVDPAVIHRLAREEGITIASAQQRIWPAKDEPGIGYQNNRDPWDRSPTERAFQQWARARIGARSQRIAVVADPSPQPAVAPRPIVVAYGAPINLICPSQAKIIIHLVALRHGVSPDDMTGARRDRKTVAARDEAICLVRSHCSHMSLPMIGRLFGDRDHTTILHSLRKRMAK